MMLPIFANKFLYSMRKLPVSLPQTALQCETEDANHGNRRQARVAHEFLQRIDFVVESPYEFIGHGRPEVALSPAPVARNRNACSMSSEVIGVGGFIAALAAHF